MQRSLPPLYQDEDDMLTKYSDYHYNNQSSSGYAHHTYHGPARHSRASLMPHNTPGVLPPGYGLIGHVTGGVYGKEVIGFGKDENIRPLRFTDSPQHLPNSVSSGVVHAHHLSGNLGCHSIYHRP